jgi:hypothetical protein
MSDHIPDGYQVVEPGGRESENRYGPHREGYLDYQDHRLRNGF